MARADGKFEPNSFLSSDFREMIDKIASVWGCGIQDLSFYARYCFENASDEKDLSYNEVCAFTRINENCDSLSISCKMFSENRFVMFRQDSGCLFISSCADDIIRAQNLLQIISSTLKLSNYSPKESLIFKSNRFDEIESRISKLEWASSQTPLRCFLSYRFSELSSSIAHEIEQFLGLLGIEVVSGLAYEPRPIEEKVRDRILSGVDFVVYLVTAEGESSWLRDELATATTAGAFPVPIVEVGSHIENGLQGNVEYIPFTSGHPGDCWIRLVQAIRYVRASRKETKNDHMNRVQND